MTGIRTEPGLLLLLCTVGIGCAHGREVPAPQPSAARAESAVRTEIEATNAQFASLLMKGDAAGLAALFAEDGEVISPAVKGFIRGRAALEQYYAARVKAVRYLEVSITTADVQVGGDFAWETGSNRVVAQTGDAAPSTRTGRYLVVWKRGADGRWRYQAEAIIPDPAG